MNIDFNKNYKYFSQDSSIYLKFKNKFMQDALYRVVDNDVKKQYDLLIKLVFETAVLHMDNLKDFHDKTLTQLVSDKNTHAYVEFLNDAPIKILMTGDSVKTKLGAILPHWSDNEDINILKEEIKTYHLYIEMQELLPITNNVVKRPKV